MVVQQQKMRFCTEQPVCVTKCLRLAKKVSPFIQPDGWAKPRQPVGPDFIMLERNFFNGKMNTGGMCVPFEQMKPSMVVFTPRSFETVCWIYFNSFFGGLNNCRDPSFIGVPDAMRRELVFGHYFHQVIIKFCDVDSNSCFVEILSLYKKIYDIYSVKICNFSTNRWADNPFVLFYPSPVRTRSPLCVFHTIVSPTATQVPIYLFIRKLGDFSEHRERTVKLNYIA